jgi:microcystin-dependent protein
MAKQIFAANILTGGVSGSLDDISYTTLEDGNIAIVIVASTSKTYFFKYSSSEAGDESSPDIIIPDDNTTGSGAWVLVGVHAGVLTADSITLASGSTPTEFSIDGTFAGNSDTAVPTEKATKTYVDTSVDSVAAMPAGMLTPFAGAAAPSGWLLCDGSAISRATYSDLFTAIGTAYGVGDGSTTFNLPDMQGNLPRGKDSDSLGDTGGSDTANLAHTHTYTDIVNHTHTFTTNAGGTHTHALDRGNGTLDTGNYVASATSSTGTTNSTESDGSHTHTGTTNNPGGGGASGTTVSGGSATQDIKNPYVVVNYIIKT